ncbi:MULTISPECIES: hypothetical protein [unclassified Rhizobium]|uniref:ribonuclease toxin HepT-like protein n=1 Tax=unclassified Rhizobium TaxID=2613769 RepID=UPI00161905C3|nr:MULTISPECIES: hypothetical protein [unclassified Rhizobium]MBB3398904.1 hypothetical protein [Rhizobium sp. BK060]MBB4171510.1 hypothetical protein [Rhizobium sp. BK538]
MAEVSITISSEFHARHSRRSPRHCDCPVPAGAPPTRPALLDLELYDALFELKGFRHLVRHKYGFDLKPDKVAANLELLKSAFPAFIDAVIRLERAMRSGDDHDGGNGETFSAGR